MGQQRVKKDSKGKGMGAAVRTKKVISDFPIALYQETDRAAAELKMSRSGIIRRAVEDMLKARKRNKLRAEIAEYFENNRELERRVMDDFRHVDAESR